MQHWARVAVLLGVLILLTLNTNGAASSATFQFDVLEPNNSVAEATRIELPYTAELLTISPQNDLDYFVFELTETSVITADVEAVSGNLDGIMELFDEHEEIIAGSDDANGLDPAITRTLTPGTYFIVVGSYSSTSGFYNLNIFEEDLGNCIDSELASDASESWELGFLSPDTQLQVTLFGPSRSDFDLILYEVTSLNPLLTIAVSSAAGSSSDEKLRYRVQSSVPLSYLISVVASEGAGVYTLCWSIEQPDADEGE